MTVLQPTNRELGAAVASMVARLAPYRPRTTLIDGTRKPMLDMEVAGAEISILREQIGPRLVETVVIDHRADCWRFFGHRDRAPEPVRHEWDLAGPRAPFCRWLAALEDLVGDRWLRPPGPILEFLNRLDAPRPAPPHREPPLYRSIDDYARAREGVDRRWRP